jgi:hypothetical protein
VSGKSCPTDATIGSLGSTTALDIWLAEVTVAGNFFMFLTPKGPSDAAAVLNCWSKLAEKNVAGISFLTGTSHGSTGSDEELIIWLAEVMVSGSFFVFFNLLIVASNPAVAMFCCSRLPTVAMAGSCFLAGIALASTPDAALKGSR